jgi:hypothetical protein
MRYYFRQISFEKCLGKQEGTISKRENSCCLQGYTIPLDKRLAADGRGLQQVHINENFAKLAEALYIADRKVWTNITSVFEINTTEVA